MAVIFNQEESKNCFDIILIFSGFLALLGIIAGSIMIGFYYSKPEVINPAIGISGIVITSILSVYEIFLLIYLNYTAKCCKC